MNKMVNPELNAYDLVNKARVNLPLTSYVDDLKNRCCARSSEDLFGYVVF